MMTIDQKCSEAMKRVADAIDMSVARNMREMFKGRLNTAWGIQHDMWDHEDILSFNIDRHKDIAIKLLQAAMSGKYVVTLYEMGYAGSWMLRSVRTYDEGWLHRDVLTFKLVRLDV